MTIRPIYTLAQYASALGITARAARKGFGRHLRAAGDEKPIDGRLVRACPLADLPPRVRQRLAAKAVAAHCRDADDWMARCTARWEPELPAAKWPPAALEKAARRREALAPILRGASAAASVSALTRAARRSFARICADQPQSERSVRRWLERARVRDRGRGEWERLELYLDDRPLQPPADPGQSASAAPLRRLYSTLRKEYPEELGRSVARTVVADPATRQLGAEMDRQKTVLKAATAQTQRTRAAVHESASRVGLRLPPTDDPRRLEAQRRLVALLGRRAPADSSDSAPTR